MHTFANPSLVDLLRDWLKDSLFEPRWRIDHRHFIPKRMCSPLGYIYIGDDHIEYNRIRRINNADMIISETKMIPAADPDFFIRLEGILDTYDQ